MYYYRFVTIQPDGSLFKGKTHSIKDSSPYKTSSERYNTIKENNKDRIFREVVTKDFSRLEIFTKSV